MQNEEFFIIKIRGRCSNVNLFENQGSASFLPEITTQINIADMKQHISSDGFS